MRYSVFVTNDAERDLEQIYDFIAHADAPEKAAYVIDKIGEVFDTLSEFPHRGSFTNELLEIGIKDVREVYFKPYRIIYEVVGQDVNILMVADGRRDMRRLLEQRLLES